MRGAVAEMLRFCGQDAVRHLRGVRLSAPRCARLLTCVELANQILCEDGRKENNIVDRVQASCLGIMRLFCFVSSVLMLECLLVARHLRSNRNVPSKWQTRQSGGKVS